jgi:hypothetical protein
LVEAEIQNSRFSVPEHYEWGHMLSWVTFDKAGKEKYRVAGRGGKRLWKTLRCGVDPSGRSHLHSWLGVSSIVLAGLSVYLS